jgi:hypothetical protein
MQSDSIKELATALAKVQAHIKPVKKDKTAKIPTKSGGSYTYHYADLSSVWDACRELLAANGLAVVQMPEAAHGGNELYLTTTLMHTSGEWMSSMLLLRPSDTTPQALGSAITYARRYALAAMIGIVADEDDDGAAASQPQQRPQAQRPARTEYVPAPDTTAELKALVAKAKAAGVKLPVSVAGKVPTKMSAEEIRIAVLDLEMAIERNLPTKEDHTELFNELEAAGL